MSLPPGKYFWAVEPVDASSHRGTRSAVGSFELDLAERDGDGASSDLIDEPVVMDPHLAWNPVPGAVAYDVEVNYSDDWSVGSKVCCKGTTIGTALSPTVILPNNVYYWRVRAIDADGNAGQWNVGTPFDKHFGDLPPTIQNLRLVDAQRRPDLPAGSAMTSPVVAWDPVPGAADYETQIVPRLGGLCDWTDPDLGTNDVWRNRVTAATAWTPLGRPHQGSSRPTRATRTSASRRTAEARVPGASTASACAPGPVTPRSSATGPSWAATASRAFVYTASAARR